MGLNSNTNETLEFVFFYTNPLFVVELLEDILSFPLQRTQVSFNYLFLYL